MPGFVRPAGTRLMRSQLGGSPIVAASNMIALQLAHFAPGSSDGYAHPMHAFRPSRLRVSLLTPLSLAGQTVRPFTMIMTRHSCKHVALGAHADCSSMRAHARHGHRTISTQAAGNHLV